MDLGAQSKLLQVRHMRRGVPCAERPWPEIHAAEPGVLLSRQARPRKLRTLEHRHHGAVVSLQDPALPERLEHSVIGEDDAVRMLVLDDAVMFSWQ